MKFLYFQDFHIKGKNSKNRLGNYFEDLLLKFDEIINIAEENNCDSILDGGDLFESEKSSYSVLDSIADKIENSKIDIYSLFGNHAMSYGHIENKEGTGLAHLQKRCKYFKYFDRKKYLGNQFEKFDIKTIEYDFGIEDKIKKENYIFEDNTAWNILVIHALVTPGKFFDNVSYIQLKDIKTNANLVLIAHYHKPYTKKIGDTTFLNIGCCGRDNIDEANIEPSVVLLDTNERSYRVIKLKSAKKANEIFDLAKYEELKANKKDIKEFLNSLKDINFQSMSIAQQIAKIGKEQKVDKEVVDYLLGKIGEAKDE